MFAKLPEIGRGGITDKKRTHSKMSGGFQPEKENFEVKPQIESAVILELIDLSRIVNSRERFQTEPSLRVPREEQNATIMNTLMLHVAMSQCQGICNSTQLSLGL